jgi:hypothetical protein
MGSNELGGCRQDETGGGILHLILGANVGVR